MNNLNNNNNNTVNMLTKNNVVKFLDVELKDDVKLDELNYDYKINNNNCIVVTNVQAYQKNIFVDELLDGEHKAKLIDRLNNLFKKESKFIANNFDLEFTSDLAYKVIERLQDEQNREIDDIQDLLNDEIKEHLKNEVALNFVEYVDFYDDEIDDLVDELVEKSGKIEVTTNNNNILEYEFFSDFDLKKNIVAIATFKNLELKYKDTIIKL